MPIIFRDKGSVRSVGSVGHVGSVGGRENVWAVVGPGRSIPI